MDLTADREQAAGGSQEQPPDDERPSSFTDEQAARVMATDERINAAVAKLEEISTPEAVYGIPQDAERTALLNCMAHLLVEKGVCTMEELFVAKREALAVVCETCAAGAVEHAEAVKKQVEVASAADLHNLEEMNREQRRRAQKQARRRGMPR